MKEYVLNDLNFKSIGKEYVLVIGNFDGVHLGHQKLIEIAKLSRLKIAILTFNPHPMTLIKDIKDVKYITPYEEKKKIFENLGVDLFLTVNFNQKVMRTSKEEFITFLKKLNFKEIVCGYDFTFAYMGQGNANDLKKCFTTHVIDKYSIDGVRVSSTNIREYLQKGNIEDANKMLGRSYSISGKVIHGNKVGRTLGFKTANIDYNDYILPKNGVYLCEIDYKKRKLFGMANIGYNPTINSQESIRLEVNIFNFDEEIYGDTLKVSFIKNVREEKKFSSKAELIEELNNNKEFGMKFFKLK